MASNKWDREKIARLAFYIGMGMTAKDITRTPEFGYMKVNAVLTQGRRLGLRFRENRHKLPRLFLEVLSPRAKHFYRDGAEGLPGCSKALNRALALLEAVACDPHAVELYDNLIN